MKQYLSPAFVLILAFGLSGCFKDDSTDPSNPISELTATTTLLEKYETEKDKTFVLSAPEVIQTNPDKEITYEWEIDYKVVSKDKELRYLGNKYGELPGRLVISNGDTHITQYFKLNVLYSYGTGVYALAKQDGKTVLSYVPFRKNAEPYLDILRVENPDKDFGKEPAAVHFQSSYGQDVIYLSTKDPNKLFMFEANMMTLLQEVPTPRQGIPIDYITDNGNDTSVSVVEGGRLAGISRDNAIFDNYRFAYSFIPNGIASLSNKILYIPSPRNGYLNSTLYFDNGSGRFVSFDEVSQSGAPKFIFEKELTGLDLVDMDLVQHKHEVVAVCTDRTSGAVCLAWFTPGTYETSGSGYKPEAPAIKDKREVPASAHLSKRSEIEISETTNLLFYSDGSNLYAYSVTSKGNFPKTPIFSTSPDEVISDLLFSKDEGTLYIAANGSGENRPGSIYAIDVNQRYKPLWAKKNITGYIKQLFERP